MSASKAADREALAVQSQLTPADIDDITKKLDDLDAESNVGPWTRRTLQLISEQPGIVSRVLAGQIGIDRYVYKSLLYELRNLGLTYALDVGHSISPRGRAYLRLAATR